MFTFQEPYLMNSAISLSLSGFYYTRFYREWNEEQLGARIGLGYQFTHDLTGSATYRTTRVNIRDLITTSIPELTEVFGDNYLHGFGLRLAHDTRDSSFLATEGHLIEASIEQVVGSYSYPRAELDVRQFFLIRERPDSSGRHVLSLTGRVGYTGDNTPIYEHYFPGGSSSLRGWDYRGAAPSIGGVMVGGHFQVLGSAQYLFPITADDMLRGVVFCDFGAAQRRIDEWEDKLRVAPGFGLRITIPMMGPAPLAFDFAFPISSEQFDREEVFSFWVGFNH